MVFCSPLLSEREAVFRGHRTVECDSPTRQIFVRRRPRYCFSIKMPRISEETAAAIRKMIQVMCQAPVMKLTTI